MTWLESAAKRARDRVVSTEHAVIEATEAIMTWLESAAKRARDRVVSTTTTIPALVLPLSFSRPLRLSRRPPAGVI
jgi:hypothetical protein